MLNENNDSNVDVLNYCILTGKFYVSGAKNAGEMVSLFKYLYILKNRLEVMKTRYCIKDKEQVFEKKWSTLYENF